MRKLILVEDQGPYKRQYEEALGELADNYGWKHVNTFDNLHDAYDYIVDATNEVEGVITDMRIHDRATDKRRPDLKSDVVFGVELVRRIANRGMKHVKFVGVTAFAATGDPVKIAVEDAKSKFPSLLDVLAKSIEPRDDIVRALTLLR
jgi:CheY-like chemotaxis protein